MNRPAATNRTVELLGAWGSWLVPLVIYLATIAPCVTAGDAGEFIVATHRFSLPHPPGYPFYILLLKLWSALPFGLGPDPLAVKCNLFSAACMVLTCGVFYRLARTLTGSAAASLAATLVLALNRTFWKFAVVTEVYALHLLLIVLVLGGLALAREGRRPWGLVLAAFAFGLGLAHHHTMLLLLPLIVFLWPKGRHAVRTPVLGAIIAFILPLLLYLLLPVLAANTPGYSESGFTAGDFVDTITRAEYRQRAAFQDPSAEQLVGPKDTLNRALGYLPRQGGWILGWVLLGWSALGWFLAPSGKRIWAFWSAVSAVLWIAAVSFLTRGSPLGMPFSYLRSVDEFLLPVNLFLALGLAWGLAPVAQGLTSRRDFYGTEGQNIIPPEYIPFAIALLLCALPLFEGVINARCSAMTHHTYAQDQARNVLEQVPEDSLLVVSGDESFMFEYLQEVRGIRTDVELLVYPFRRVIAAGGTETTMPPVASLAWYIDSMPGDRACVFSFSPPATILPLLRTRCALRLDGVAFTLVERTPGTPDFFPGDPNIWMQYQLRNTEPATLLPLVPDDFEYETFSRYINGLRASVAWLDDNGYGLDPSRDTLQDMANTFETALAKTNYPVQP